MAATHQSAPRRIWQTLSSIKTGVILLIVVVIVSAAGTVILQRPATDPADLQHAYSPQMLRILDVLGLTDVFHAWWFIALLLLVSLSIVAASIDRFPNSWRFFARPYKVTDETFRRMLASQKQFPVRNEETALSVVEPVLRQHGYRPERVERNGRVSLFAERHRKSELAVYVVHASLLLIFAGGIVDGLFGWRGSLTLVPGEQSAKVEMNNGTEHTLPFALRCDGAGQENYADGTPKKWWSRLAVIENGREAIRKEIVVNDPLVYNGIRFYQSSYGPTDKVRSLQLSATPSDGKAVAQTITLAGDGAVQLDEDTSVRLGEFIPDYVVRDGQVYTRSLQVENPAARLIVESKKAGTATNFWIPAIPEVEHNASSPYQFQVVDLKMNYFTGLQVSHEPGQWGVWSGVLLMALGLAMVFYMVHTRIWITTIRDSHGQYALWIGGAANKNRDVFEQKFEDLSGDIRLALKEQAAPGRVEHEEGVSLAGAGIR